jgi:hypothetical protein
MITLKELKKLRFDGRYIHSSSAEVFEFFGLAWDIEAMQKRILELNLQPKEVALLPLKSWLGLLGVNKEYAMQSEKTDPIILIELTPNELMIVDGVHRTYRDLEKGLTTGNAYIITFTEQIKFLYRIDMFDRVIEMAKKKLTENLNSTT